MPKPTAAITPDSCFLAQDPIDNLFRPHQLSVDRELHDEQHLSAVPVGGDCAVLLNLTVADLVMESLRHVCGDSASMEAALSVLAPEQTI